MFLGTVPWDGAEKTRERGDLSESQEPDAFVLFFWYPPLLGKHSSLIRASLSYDRSGGERLEGNGFAEPSYGAEGTMAGIADRGER